MQAALETRDELLRYDGEPITVMYHAMSGGRTEDVQAVFSQSLPYLVSVDSTGEESARGFYTDATFSYEEAARLLNAYFGGLNLTAQHLRQTFSVADYTGSGRVGRGRGANAGCGGGSSGAFPAKHSFFGLHG